MSISIRHVALMGVLMMAGEQATWAHDAAEHAKEAAEAKASVHCEDMQKMDISKMKANDPIMQAMMSKCTKKTAKSDKTDSKTPAIDHNQMQSMPTNIDHSKMKMPTGMKMPTETHSVS